VLPLLASLRTTCTVWFNLRSLSILRKAQGIKTSFFLLSLFFRAQTVACSGLTTVSQNIFYMDSQFHSCFYYLKYLKFSQKYYNFFVLCHSILFNDVIKFFTHTFEFIVFTLAHTHTLTQLKYTVLTCSLSVSPFVPLCAVQTFPQHSHLQENLNSIFALFKKRD
jgi:hypothetical protein